MAARGGPAGAVRARLVRHRHLVTGSALLVLTVAVNAVSGALFWLLAARRDSQTEVGHATALFTSLQFVAFIAGLGLLVALARYASGSERDDEVYFSWACVATAAAAVVVGIAYLELAAPAAADELRDWHGATGPALFAALAVGTALSLLVDVRFMTQRRWGLVVARSALAALARFPLLAYGGGTRAVWLLVAVAAPGAVSGLVAALWGPRLLGGRHSFAPRPASTSAMVRYSAVNWLSTVTYQAPSFVVPVIVLLDVDADTNASFYVAWGVANLACFVPTAIGQALLAEGGRDGAHVRAQVRLAVVAAGSLMAAGAVVATAGKGLITTAYGEDYAEAARILPALVVAAVPWAVTSVYLTEARVRHQSAATVAITVALSASILGLTAVLVPDRGLDGAATGFLVGNLVTAVVAVVAHLRMRQGPTPPAGPELLAESVLPAGHGP